MAIVLISNDPDVIGRCRRAVSAEHQLDLLDDPAKAGDRVRSLAPAAVLVDASLLDAPIDRQVAEIASQAGSAKVIVLTEAFNEDEEIALLKAGAKGCCRRGTDPDSLERIINVAQSGGVWVTRALLPRLVTELRRAAAAQKVPAPLKPAGARQVADKLGLLSGREQEIVRLIVNGATNKEVASALGISERTVKGHLSNVFQKLDVTDRLKLVLLVRGQ